MKRSDEYHANAGDCLRLAQAIENPDSKALLLEMAQAWVKLAEYAREKDEGDRPTFAVLGPARARVRSDPFLDPAA